MAGHAADLLPVFQIVMNNRNAQPQAPPCTITTTWKISAQLFFFAGLIFSQSPSEVMFLSDKDTPIDLFSN